ncbi:TIR domain-containing protein [Halodesulfovibrio aestuarii]|uniref:MTH538 TIR-like domain n=1 Tax=Halodesulfovibrio aestuarii TaxID=126333 RepID=A0A8G2C7Y6_9BACT|nr:TIR domain-containing protein [Halodesulfovibrio aestuarii]SHI72787.1 MTH538 TIR-like domain [Halodesulfovibrio aestuarii]
MPKRRVFYSFHYKPDASRASQVRNIGVLEGSRPATDNDWEKVKKGGEKAIKEWIEGQMKGKSCAVVLVGENTGGRKWITHEIVKAWDKGMGVVGIKIHGLKDLDGKTSRMGGNPFDHVIHSPSKKKLSTLVKCYNPVGATSKEKYAWIKKHLTNAVEEAIKIRSQHD